MRPLSDNQLLQRAIGPAILDRKSLADAYGNQGPWAADALADAAKFNLLRRRRMSALNAEELAIAKACFIYAEQWEASLADALEECEGGAQHLETAKIFREARLRIWGITVLEQKIAGASPFDLKATLERTPPTT